MLKRPKGVFFDMINICLNMDHHLIRPKVGNLINLVIPKELAVGQCLL